MSALRRAIVGGARALVAPRGRAFRRALEQPAEAQARVRRTIAADLARTAYGRSLGVTGDADDFTARVPIADWEALAPWVERQRAEEGAIIAAERVLFYEKTSGSTGPAKYVPYTAALRRTFSRMFTSWAHDLLAHGPKLSSGRFYFSVSPSFSAESTTAHGVPVGTADDRDYLEGWLRPVLAPFVVAPPGLGRERSPEAFLRRLSTALLAARELEVISVWSPSFLLAVLDHIDAQRLGDWRAAWPQLKVISCWDRAGAAPLAERLRAHFPGVLVQGKGLLATEAPVTIPLVGAPAPVPLVDDVLVELLDARGALVPLLDAAEGSEYRVVVSPRGGLPRYALGDRVVARGRVGATPCLDFVGRGGGVSDLVGEKLSEAFVSGVIAQLALPPRAAAALVPVRAPRDHYVLLIDADADVALDARTLGARVERALADAHHYHHARLLGQLGPARALIRAGAAQWLVDQQLRRGLKLGDIKSATLVLTPADDPLRAQLEAAT